MRFIGVNIVSVLMHCIFYTSASYADIRINSESYNPLTGNLEASITHVTTAKIRVERPDIDKERYQIIDLVEQKKYLVLPSDDKTIVSDLNPESDYRDKSSLVKAGEGPILLNGTKRHYVVTAHGGLTD